MRQLWRYYNCCTFRKSVGSDFAALKIGAALSDPVCRQHKNIKRAAAAAAAAAGDGLCRRRHLTIVAVPHAY